MTQQELLAQFQTYLDTVYAATEAPSEPDQFSLLTELTALKTEVKQQSRQTREALEQFKAVFSTLDHAQQSLQRELQRRQNQEEMQRREILRPLLYQLLDLYDRMEAAVRTPVSTRRGMVQRLFPQALRWMEAMRQGQSMSLERLTGILAGYRVLLLETVGRPLDPHAMQVIETECRSGIADGIVLSELRKGFSWEGELLRAAEVKVNKLNEEVINE